MKYQEFFQLADFESVWSVLSHIYNESVEAEPLYKEVFDAVRTMSIDPVFSTEVIEIGQNCDDELMIKGAPDPQEWLVGREVNTERFEEVSVSELTGHLLYWSTMYGIKTQQMQKEGFKQWLEHSSAGPYYTLPDDLGLDNIGEAVMMKYLFLDFDGVLNTEQYQAQLTIEGKTTKDEYGPLFDPKVVDRLAEIIEHTKAEIVIISSWQNIHTAEALKEMWEKRGLPGIISINQKGSHAEIVEEYLRFPSNTPYIILDDEDHYPDEHLEHLIRINPVTGIKDEDVPVAIAMLNVYDELPADAFIDHEYEQERERIGNINEESRTRKKLRYWKDTITDDEPFDWSYNLRILRKKIEYNIGYYRLTQRFVGWERTVSRMLLCTKLITIALGEDKQNNDENDKTYINIRNFSRFHSAPMSFDEEKPLHYCFWKRDLRQAKAYKLLWQLLSKDMKKWWD